VYYIRNCLAPSYVTPNQFGGWGIFWIREVLQYLGGFTVQYRDAHANWDEGGAGLNLLLTVADAILNGDEISSATGGFTAGMADCCVTVVGTAENRTMCRIMSVIDTNTIKLDPDSLPPDGFTSESGVTIRVTNCGQGGVLPATTELTMNPPSGVSQPQIKVGVTVQTLDIKCYPAGDRPVANPDTGNPSTSVNISMTPGRQVRMNVWLQGPNALFIFVYSDTSYPATFAFINFGEVVNAAPTDTPGFSNAVAALGDFDFTDNNLHSAMYGINAALATFTMMHTRWSPSMDAGSAAQFDAAYPYRLEGRNGKSYIRTPRAWMYDLATGGWRRGMVPIIKLCHPSIGHNRPVGSNNYWVFLGDVVVPRLANEKPFILDNLHDRWDL